MDTKVEPRQGRRAAESRSWLANVWTDRRIGWAVGVLVVALFALASAWESPRGPITSGQALDAMVRALLVGAVAGVAIGSRWILIAAPATFVLTFELARLDAVGPTVDAIQIGSTYGLIAFVAGRLFHGILVLVPLMLGAAVGVAIAGRTGHPTARTMGPVGWATVGVVALGLTFLGVLIARPASTAPILGVGSDSPPGSIAELVTIPIGGHDQTLLIRGRSLNNPILLYLAGGPGGTDIGALRRDVTLEQDFTVVAWDQRGAGKSYAALDPIGTFTLDQMISDTIEVTNYLRERFGQEKVYLVGQSWGSTLGALAVAERPDLFHSFVGVGQMVSQRETDLMFWEDTLTWAESTGNTRLAARLRTYGPPPYEDVYRYDPVVAYEHEWNRYPGMDLSNEMPSILFVPEYTFMDRVNAFRGFLDSAATLYPQLQELDFRQDLTSLGVPYTMVMGEHEARGRAVLADEWFQVLDAPMKERHVIDGGGHRAHFDDPGRFAEIMRDVLESTRGGAG